MTVPRIQAESVTLGYDGRAIVSDLSVDVPVGGFTVIVGPNACGKSTLLRAMARIMAPTRGTVLLDGEDVAGFKGKEFARRLGLLPQSALAPDGITVAELVMRGRFPYQSVLRQWRDTDEAAVSAAMQATNTTALSTRRVDELSGGQRQRVWVAMVLAQETSTLLLDEPTSFLDIAHQYDLLDLFDSLHRDHGRTLVAVLHDLNQAARYATKLIAMKDGAVVAEGAPGDVLTQELVEEVFELPCIIVPDPLTGTPTVVPRPRRAGLA